MIMSTPPPLPLPLACARASSLFGTDRLLFDGQPNGNDDKAWVVTIAPQEEIQIPFEYTVEWPVGKEIQFTS